MRRELVRLCIHEQIRGHEIHCGSSNCLLPQDHDWCPGGEFLPEDATGLTAAMIHRALLKPDSKWSRGTIMDAALAYSRLLAADQVGEPG